MEPETKTAPNVSSYSQHLHLANKILDDKAKSKKGFIQVFTTTRINPLEQKTIFYTTIWDN